MDFQCQPRVLKSTLYDPSNPYSRKSTLCIFFEAGEVNSLAGVLVKSRTIFHHEYTITMLQIKCFPNKILPTIDRVKPMVKSNFSNISSIFSKLLINRFKNNVEKSFHAHLFCRQYCLREFRAR